MKKLRIYVDTSVIGGCFDPEFQAWSNGLIEDFQMGTFGLVLSDVTAAEIERAPEQARELHRELLPIGVLLAGHGRSPQYFGGLREPCCTWSSFPQRYAPYRAGYCSGS
jgi:hypothetical protein